MKKRYRKLSNLFVVLLLMMNVLSSFVPAFAMEATTSVVSKLVETNSDPLEQGDKPATEAGGGNAKDETSPAEAIEAITTTRAVVADEENAKEAEQIFASPVSVANRTITSLVLKQNGKVLKDNDLTDYWGSMEVILAVELTGDIRDGDTLTLDIPPQLRLTTAGTFPVTTSSRAEVGQTNMDPDARTVTVTFNDYFTTRPDEQQINLQFFVNWDHTNSKGNALNTLNFEGMSINLRKGSQGTNPVNETLTKWGRVYFADRDQVRWTVRVNGKQDRVSNVVVTDTFDSSNQEYVPGSLTGDYISSSVPYVVIGKVPADKLRVDANGFTYTDDLIDGVTVVIYYRTRVKDGGESFFYKNSATYAINNGADLVNSVNAVYVYEGGSGKGFAVTADKIVLKANKTLTGRPLQDGEFQFQLKDPQGQVIQTKSNVGGAVTFDRFGIQNLGNYRYTIEEVNNNLPGVTYDSTPVTVDIEVVEINNTKYAKIIYSDDQTFENSYQMPTTPVAPVIQATIQSEPGVQGDIEVELVDEQGAVVATQTVQNANGTVTFTLPNETTENTKTYKVRQKGVADTVHVLYDKEEKEVTVAITKDDANNALVATSTPNEVVFTNVYKDPTPVAPVIQATIQSEPGVQGDIEVELVDEQGAVVATQTVQNANGTVTFTLPNETTENTKAYKVRQKGVADTVHVLYDKEDRDVTVTVTKDDATNTLTAKATPEAVVFVNVYKDPTPTKVMLEAIVKHECYDMKLEPTEFELVDSNGTVIQTVTSRPDGKVLFSELPYDKAGEETYKIRQKATDTAFVDYDNREIEVTVKVAANDQHQLVATPEYKVEPTFVNMCIPPVQSELTIEANVKYEGNGTVPGPTEFELLDSTGNVLQRATSKDGKVVFEKISVTQTGKQTYQIRQIAGKESDVNFDTKVMTVTVDVTNVDSNTLVATATYTDDATFVNTSTVAQNKPSVPTNESNQVAQTKEHAQTTQNKNAQSQLPNTGTANTWLTSIIGCSLLVVAGAIVAKKTEKQY